MISKEFCKKVANNGAKGEKYTYTRRHIYCVDYIGNHGGGHLEPGIYIRRIDKEDPDYAPIVARYCLGSGWYICG